MKHYDHHDACYHHRYKKNQLVMSINNVAIVGAAWECTEVLISSTAMYGCSRSFSHKIQQVDIMVVTMIAVVFASLTHVTIITHSTVLDLAQMALVDHSS